VGAETRPRRSGGMLVLVEKSPEAVVSADVEVRDRAGVGDR